MNATRLRIPIFLFAVLLTWMFGTSTFGQTMQRTPSENWSRFKNVEDAGFDPEELQRLLDNTDLKDLAALLVVYDGAVVLRYGDIETRYMCHSVRKSLMSILFGMYDIDLNQTLAELEIDDSPKLTETEKTATIKDLLKSRSGVYHKAAYEPATMKRTRPKRESHSPGTHWWYNNWDFNTLLTIFEQETGDQIFEAFQNKIAKPLGLQDFRLRDGYYHREASSKHPAYPFRLSARDMARIGWLMASKGQWGDQQLFPQDWFAESTARHSEIEPWNGYEAYGYLWWIGTRRDNTIISALGNGNNSIDIIPERKLVFVFRANTFKGKNISSKVRWRLINGVMDAQAGTVKSNPKLVELETKRPMPASYKEARLDEKTLTLFPIDLPRRLPKSLPENIRDQKIRIEVDQSDPDAKQPTLVLFTRPPPAMQLDLIPIGGNKFWIEGLNEIGIIEFDDQEDPVAFFMKDDLIACINEAKRNGDSESLQVLTGLLKEHFDDESP